MPHSFLLHQPRNRPMGEFFRDRNRTQELNLNSQLKELTLYQANIEIHHLGKEAINRLECDPYLPGLIFVDKEKFVGMISRQSFFEWMSRPYSLELFTKRPLRRFYDYNQTEYLVCSGEDSISKTVPLALQRASHLVYEPILIELQANDYRLLSVHDLLIAHAKIHELATQQLKKSEAVLRERSTGLTKALKKLKTTKKKLMRSEKMSALGQTVSGLVHEINNPVSFIDDNIQHAQDYAQDLISLLTLYRSHYPQPHEEIEAAIKTLDVDALIENFTKVLESMKIGTHRIGEIVASLHNFSQFNEPKIKEVDLHKSLDNTISILQHRLKQKSHRPEIKIVKNYGDLPLIGCYIGQLNQVFMNLLSNAIDAIEEKIESEKNASFVPQIRIETCYLESDNVEIRIIDNGIGIREEDRPKLFSPFFTTKKIRKGTSLGLSISYAIIVKNHQGRLHCCSNLGEGTEFIIHIPQ